MSGVQQNGPTAGVTQQTGNSTSARPQQTLTSVEQPLNGMFTSVTNLWKALRGSAGGATTSLNKRARTASAQHDDDGTEGRAELPYDNNVDSRNGKRRRMAHKDDEGEQP
ncbi:hypothetical protein ACM66B_001166 [Microbotryomycetes sp. NB124-2]